MAKILSFIFVRPTRSEKQSGRSIVNTITFILHSSHRDLKLVVGKTLLFEIELSSKLHPVDLFNGYKLSQKDFVALIIFA